MADMTEEEIKRAKGLLKDTNSNAANGGKRFQIPTGKNALNLPQNVDWNKAGELGKLTMCRKSTKRSVRSTP